MKGRETWNNFSRGSLSPSKKINKSKGNSRNIVEMIIFIQIPIWKVF
jgi:hypothetical protein